ncbi:Hypothetical predicted protein [Mytilus galloprovincialis]|uniref:Ig-like domain-containing protein n=1 Tax=Mytilus galloprovincialis TaxID=29158 RepID=A0A8B6BU67_MYTGA|nr:Hypothetical predicted protein [Mytilus galloprovincialis]
MRFLLFVVIHSVLAEDTFGENIVSDIKTNHYVGETAILSCNFFDDASGNRWRRAGAIIATSSNITLADPEGKHFNVVEDEEQDKYNLEIYNVTKLDSGLYWCEMQRDGQITQQRVTLFILGKRTTELITETMTTETANMETSTALIYQTTTVAITREKTTEKTTDVDRPPVQEQFIYWLLGAGLVLVLCLSVICNACLNRKCRSKSKTLKHRSEDKPADDIQLNKLVEEEDNKPNVHGKAIMIQIEEDSSVYESIDENKMTHYDYPDQNDIKNIERSPGLPLRPNLLLQSKPLYLDVVDDNDSTTVMGSIGDLSLNKSKSAALGTSSSNKSLNKPVLNNDADTLSPHLNTNSISIVQVHSEKEPESMNSNDGDESSDNSDVASVKTDEYLNPYVPLIPNDMEYLQSYTTPIKQELPPINKASSVEETIDREHKPKSDSTIESFSMNIQPDSVNTLNEKHSIYEDNARDPYVPLNKNEIEYLPTYTPITSASTYSKTKSECADTSTLNKVSSSKNNFLTNEYEDGLSSNTNMSKV